MNADAKEKVEYYLRQPYTFITERHEQGGKAYFSMRVLELEGCITTGDTIEEAAHDIQDAMREWLRTNLKLGKPIPPALKSRAYSGKVALRMPPALHESLMFNAVREGVSLNQYMVATLSKSEGRHQGENAAAAAKRTRRHRKPEAD